MRRHTELAHQKKNNENKHTKLANCGSWQVIWCFGRLFVFCVLLLIVSTCCQCNATQCEISIALPLASHPHTLRSKNDDDDVRKCYSVHFVRSAPHKREKERQRERNGTDWLHIVAARKRESGISVRKLFISNWPTIPLLVFYYLHCCSVVTAVCVCVWLSAVHPGLQFACLTVTIKEMNRVWFDAGSAWQKKSVRKWIKNPPKLE